ncbi:GNAT family N-acetyltransferase [Psychrosphaera sp. 1_MG-2023]|uniref:GNAT family N-acetyltransferase n=1 Tax=Psychrosphaera sp. 1_MG-2023 TaxID=3062643 RepID=UPI0026E47C2A|nr:GNAT family N-acetyltransferase [Psychrosphaera sp. 1_MG-2023]MDO6718955.1 GNAT family N-acetyltransferase [Psychrosphaera sp. 1_MG-2023]
MVTGYWVSNNLKDMDLNAIHGYISQSYWAKDIPIETMEKAINNSVCFGIFTDSGEQIAFARMITDRATFAYLADVFVLEHHRGIGLSKWLMEEVVKHPELQGLRRMALATRDAHELYKQFGFTELHSPHSFMELHQPDVYKKT